MHLAEGYMYHVYNRGNNRQQLFFTDDHYLHFLRLVRRTIFTASEILAWCLMPNHFHFLLAANQKSVEILQDKAVPRQQFSEQMKLLLSSYTKAINKQQGFTGSLFQQKSKAVCVNPTHEFSYALTVFHYLHQNPMKAGLVKRMEDWQYSSFADYLQLRAGTLCNKALAYQLLDLDQSRLYEESYMVINEERLRSIVSSIGLNVGI